MVVLASASAISHGAVRPDEPPPIGVARADLAQAYLAVETVLAEWLDRERPSAEAIVEVNLAFDSATSHFFSRDYSRAIADLYLLKLDLADRTENLPRALDMKSLVVTMTPAVLSITEPQPTVQVRVHRQFRSTVPEHRLLTLTLIPPVDARDTDPISIAVTALAGDRNRSVLGTAALSPDVLSPGVWSVILEDEDGNRSTVSRWHVTRRPVRQARKEFSQRLDDVESVDESVIDAVRQARYHVQLLTDRPLRNESSQFLADHHQLIESLEREIAAIEAGRNPYAGAPGELWRGSVVRDLSLPALPARLYAPPQVEAGRPLPLVIALHGMGGDENMFMHAYGAGEIKRLADRHGFLICSPLTYPVSMNPDYFEVIIDLMDDLYGVDRRRIYVLGHSMGAGAAMSLLGRRADRIAAGVAIAGNGSPFSDGVTRPVLVISGGLDPIVQAARIRSAVQRTERRGWNVEYREKGRWGHTLIVGAVLEEAIAWLLEHSLP